MKKGNLKIRLAERGKMKEMLIATGWAKPLVLLADDKLMLMWMSMQYGPNHFRHWRTLENI